VLLLLTSEAGGQAVKRTLLVISSVLLLAACSSGGTGVSMWCKIVPQPYYTNALQADYGIKNTGSSAFTVSGYTVEIFKGSQQDFAMSSTASADFVIAPRTDLCAVRAERLHNVGRPGRGRQPVPGARHRKLSTVVERLAAAFSLLARWIDECKAEPA
jgi:hypothetical protein